MHKDITYSTLHNTQLPFFYDLNQATIPNISLLHQICYNFTIRHYVIVVFHQSHICALGYYIMHTTTFTVKLLAILIFHIHLSKTKIHFNHHKKLLTSHMVHKMSHHFAVVLVSSTPLPNIFYFDLLMISNLNIRLFLY